jgi:uncharacterized membrane protein required for colicin V production
MILLAGILVGGLCIWFAIRIGFYETWAMLFNIVIAIYVALFLAQPILNFLPEEASNIPCRDALTLIVLAVVSFLILHGITYILFTSQFKVTFPKIFDILFTGFLGFFGGFLILSFAAIIIALTPFGEYAGITKEMAKENMSYSYSYRLFDGINWFVSPPEKNIKSQEYIEQFIDEPQPNTQNKNPQQAELDKVIRPNDT